MVKILENDKAKIYTIKNNGEYGTFILMYLENYLEIICHTSFGTYAHTWNHPGDSPLKFLLELNFSSFIYKMTQGKQYVLDNEKQSMIMKKLVLEKSDLKNWNNDDINYYEEIINDITSSGKITEDDFKLQITYSELYDEIYDGEYENIETISKIDDQLTGLWNELWIPLIKKIKLDNKINEN